MNRQRLQRTLMSRQFERAAVKTLIVLPIVIYVAYLAGRAFTA